MSVKLPNGSVVTIASGYGAPLPFTAITNATEAIVSMADTGELAVGKLVEVTSGWTRLDNKIVRVKALSANGSGNNATNIIAIRLA